MEQSDVWVNTNGPLRCRKRSQIVMVRGISGQSRRKQKNISFNDKQMAMKKEHIRGDELVEKWPQYSKMIHDTIIAAPNDFYLIMDVQAHLKIVRYICDYYGFHHTSKIEKEVLRALPEHMQPEEGYHGPTCEDCGGLNIKVERITIRKIANRLKNTDQPLQFDIKGKEASLQPPTVYPL
jgi:sulfur relay (sulfurtransferase) DsrC/TusE family protein